VKTFSRNRNTTGGPPAEAFATIEPLPPDFWCPECEKTGYVPVVYVLKNGRIQQVSALCHCRAGVRNHDPRQKRPQLKYADAVKLGILDPTNKTKHAHWVFSQRRYLDLIGDKHAIERMEAILESENPGEALRAWWKKHPPSGPMANTIAGAYRRK
jgi:hypothetical protein